MMNNPAANKSHTPCQSWAGQNGWSASSSQGLLLNPLASSQHVSLDLSSDQRPSYDHLQASSQSCMSDLSTLPSRNNIHHAGLYKSTHVSSISSSSSTSLFANTGIPSASHIISFAQQTPHASSMLVTANQGKTIPPPSLPQSNQGLQHLPLLPPHDPYKASFQTPLTSQGLPNRLQDVPISLPSCRQREQPQWISSSHCRETVNESVPGAAVHPNKDSLQEGTITLMANSESRRSLLLNQRAQLLKQLAEMDKLLESLPPDDSSDGHSPDIADKREQTNTSDADQVQLSAEKLKSFSADSSSPNERYETCDTPKHPVSSAKAAKMKNASSDSGDDSDSEYLPDSGDDDDDGFSGFKSETNGFSSEEDSNHCSPSPPTDKTPPPSETKRKSGSSLSKDKSVLALKKTRTTSLKKASEALVQQMSNSNAKGVHYKRNYCLFCSKPVVKMARHLETVHSDKAEVAVAFQHPVSSKERQMIWKKLTNQGNFAHNKEVLRTGQGELAVRMRSKQTGQAQDFLHCLYCQGLFRKKNLAKHMCKCPEKKGKNEVHIGRKRIASRCALEAIEDLGISDSLRSILCEMVYDDVTKTVIDDHIILQFGEQMFDQYGCDENKHNYIRQNLRQVARLLLEAQKITPMQKLEDFFYPSNFQHVVSAVNVLAGYNSENKTFSIPSLALKLGYHLQKTCSIVESNAEESGDEKLAEAARNFLSVYQKKWNKLVSNGALTTLKEIKSNTEKQVPFAQDVKRLHFHTENVHQVAEKKLRDSPSTENYAALARVILARTIIFNRRRPREVSSIKLTAFMSRKKSNVLDNMDISVSKLERTMCGFLVRVDIRGNCGRLVPVLLTPSIVSSLEFLVSVRDACGVLSKNPYLFSRPSALSAYNGSECLQRYVRECGAKNPEVLTSKKIRKHFGTMLQLMNLDKNEADQIFGPNKRLQILQQYSDTTLDDVEMDSEALQPSGGQDVASWDHSEHSSAGRGPADFHHHQTQGLSTRYNVTKLPKADQSDAQGSTYKPKHKWDEAEVRAVERHLMRFIQGHKVPQKNDCIECLEAEPKALRNRSWKGVKDYVRNRITTLKRQSGSLKKR